MPGGYSLGTAVTDVVLAVELGASPNPLPPAVFKTIAACAVRQWRSGPITNFSRLARRTIESCREGDLPPCRPQHLGGQLAPAPRRLYYSRAWWQAAPISLPEVQ